MAVGVVPINLQTQQLSFVPQENIQFTQTARHDGESIKRLYHADNLDVNNQNTLITGYPTEKNIDMLKRIIETSSRPGDLVLDCFAGSGTTLVAAEQLGRQWIGVDIGDEAIRTIQNRFINGSRPMGDYVKKRDKTKRTPSALALFGDEVFEDEACQVEMKCYYDDIIIRYDMFEEL